MIRTVALVGHSGSGKTTLGEALLYFTGGKDRMGKVEEGSTTSDYTPEEKAHRVSVRTAVLPLTYQGHRIYLLDAPGYTDFVGEIRGAMEAADAAVVAVSAEAGVQIGTERAWTVAERLELPRMVVVTKLEKGGDFFALLEDLRSTLGPILPAHLPLYENGQWIGLIDVLHDRAFRYDKGRPVITSIPEGQQAQVEKYRNEAREAIIETDESLLEKYLEGGEVEEVALSRAFHEAVRKGQVFPVAIGSSAALIGLDMLLDLFLEALPSPEERWGQGSPAAKVFKVQVDPFMGQVAFARLYRGRLKAGDTLQSDNGTVRLAHLYTAKGKDLIELEEAEAGTILALPKADGLHKGMELWQGERLEFPSARLPDPVAMVAITPESRADEAKLGDALRKLLEEDPSLRFERNPETGEQILWGMGDLHLETAKERLADYGVKIISRPPKIPYRETIRKKAEGQGKHKKQTGGHGQYGDVWLRLEPHPDYEFVWEITGGVIPTKYMEAVEMGIKEAAKTGPLAGYPVIGFRAVVYHGSYHEVDSSDMAFQLAAQLAFRNVVTQASPTLLEPIYTLKIFVPQDRVGDILSDMQSRRGRILGLDQEGALAVVSAEAPLAELLEYSRTLSGLTQGTGAYSLEFSHYAEVPPNLAQKVIAERQKAEA
ncbi:elongation factor G [Meiothermus taiwanensis]|jgi:elongation factor G|uniref:Elongation factor G n=1 Tax=Meiothermus taiwanensis TaxID=172827 RepID=A0A399DXA5_9DEIN|nr:elongation factor G [Meiothermus taiwanensis]KIQ53637.1 elongation factor G [Meiothermus taiwanensis]KZK15008.1 elongation factor G [Meiothermus taiwanensis]RIH76747.1 Elongation factor G [Meiothermus taiwanensis]